MLLHLLNSLFDPLLLSYYVDRFDPLGLLPANSSRLLVFPIFRYGVYLMKVIPETCRAH